MVPNLKNLAVSIISQRACETYYDSETALFDFDFPNIKQSWATVTKMGFPTSDGGVFYFQEKKYRKLISNSSENASPARGFGFVRF